MRRQDLLAALLFAVLVAAATLVIALVVIARWFEPEGFLGRPARIEACGRTYRLDPGAHIWTRAEVDAATDPGVEPEVFEPVVGLIPLGAPLTGSRNFNGNNVCDTIVWLHTGPDAYLGYVLSGGP